MKHAKVQRKIDQAVALAVAKDRIEQHCLSQIAPNGTGPFSIRLGCMVRRGHHGKHYNASVDQIWTDAEALAEPWPHG